MRKKSKANETEKRIYTVSLISINISEGTDFVHKGVKSKL